MNRDISHIKTVKHTNYVAATSIPGINCGGPLGRAENGTVTVQFSIGGNVKPT